MAEIITEPRPATGPIRLPEWDDVLHVRPRAPLIAQDRKAWREYLELTNQRQVPVTALRARVAAIYDRGGQISHLTRAQTETLLRGRQIYQDQRASAIPGWRRQMIRALVTLDNIEDDLSTIEWVTRPLTSRWAPTRWAAKVVRRTSNVIDDLEKVIAGPALYKAVAKRRSANKNRRTARAAQGKLSMVQRGARWIKDNFGHLLEAGQSLDTHAGVGISLGAIFGAMEEAQDRLLISAYEGAKFLVAGAARVFAPAGGDLDELLELQQQANIDKVRKVGAPLIDQMIDFTLAPIRGIPPFRRALDALIGAANLQRANDTYTGAEHTLALYRSATLLPLFAPVFEHLSDPRVAARIPELDAPRLRVENEYTRELAEEAGVALDAEGYALGEDQEPRARLVDHLGRVLEESSRARESWLSNDCADDRCQLQHSLIETCAGAGGWTLTGREDGLRVIPDPDTRAELLAYHLENLPPAGTSRAALESWLADQRAAIAAHPEAYNGREWSTITARHWPLST